MTNYWKVTKDITVVRGKTWTAKFRYLTKCGAGKKPYPVDLSTWSAKFVIREHIEDSVADITLTDVSGITLTSGGEIEILMTDVQTSTLTVGDSVYELELDDGTNVIGFATGKAKVFEEIAK